MTNGLVITGYGTNFGVIPRTLEYCFQRLGESVYTRGDVKPNRFEGHVSLVGDDFKRLEEAKRKLLRDSKTVCLIQMQNVFPKFLVTQLILTFQLLRKN